MDEEIKRLQELRAKIAALMKAMLDKAEEEDRGFDDEEQAKWHSMRAELEDYEARLEARKEYLELQRSIAVPSNPLPPETREYELDDFGNPMKPKKSPDQRQDEEQKYYDAFMALMRSDQHGTQDLTPEQVHTLRTHYISDELRAQGTIPKSSGGYLIPTLLQNRIIEVMKDYGGIFGVATVLNTSGGEPLNWPTNDDTENEGELVAEHAQVGETELEFGQKELGAYKYSSKIIRVSIELLQDSAFALDSFIVRKFGQRLGRITSRHFATGTGNNQPQGLMTSAGVGYTAESPVEISYVDLLRIKHSIDPAYRNSRSCRWLFNDSTLLGFKEMLDADGRPLWKPSIADGTPATIDGDPYIIDQGVDSVAAENVPLAYGDMGEYVVRQVMGFTLHRLVEKFIDYGQIGFLAFMRTDADLMDSAAVKTLKMASGGSPETAKAKKAA